MECKIPLILFKGNTSPEDEKYNVCLKANICIIHLIIQAHKFLFLIPHCMHWGSAFAWHASYIMHCFLRDGIIISNLHSELNHL